MAAVVKKCAVQALYDAWDAGVSLPPVIQEGPLFVPSTKAPRLPVNLTSLLKTRCLSIGSSLRTLYGLPQQEQIVHVENVRSRIAFKNCLGSCATTRDDTDIGVSLGIRYAVCNYNILKDGKGEERILCWEDRQLR